MDGPSPGDKAKGLVRFGGVATLRVLWRKNRDAIMRACGLVDGPGFIGRMSAD